MEHEKTAQQQANALTQSYLQKLSNKELTELFVSISAQFTTRLTNCKDVDELKSLQDYLYFISGEIKLRDLPQQDA